MLSYLHKKILVTNAHERLIWYKLIKKLKRLFKKSLHNIYIYIYTLHNIINIETKNQKKLIIKTD